MKFKVKIVGQASDLRVDMDLRTESYQRVEQLREYARKNKLQCIVEVVD